MYRLLIAEDEKWIRAGLVRTVDWEGLGFDQVLEAPDGGTALELALACQPEVIISDIKMPRLTGLELAERLRQEGSDAQIILISGYSEFSYAQRAIHYGVTEYLLKPIEMDKLLGAVRACVGRLGQKREAPPPEPDRAILRGHYLQRAIRGEGPAEEEACLQWLEKVGIRCRGSKAQVAVLCLPEEQPVGAWELAGLAAGEPGRYFFENRPGELCGLLLSREGEGPVALQGICQRFFEAWQFHPLAGLGAPAEVHRLAQSYRQAVLRCEWSFFFPEEPAGAEEPRGGGEKRYLPPPCAQLGNLLLCSGPQEAVRYVREELARLLTAVTPDSAPRLRRELLRELEQAVSQCRPPELPQLLRRLREQPSLRELQRHLEELIPRLAQVEGDRHGNTGQLIRMAIDYVQKYYYEDISMKMVAQHLCVNPSYFSHVFSERTGTPFVRYLNAYRVAMAKKLLADPTIKVYEVANLVGFDDYRYFSKLFKRLEGVSPDLYRNVVLKGAN